MPPIFTTPKPVLSNSEAVDRILDWNKSTNALDARKWGDADLGTGATITFDFLGPAQVENTATVNSNDERALTVTEINAMRDYLQLIEDVADIDFVEASNFLYSSAGDFDFQARNANIGNTPPVWSSRPGEADELLPVTTTFAAGSGTFNQAHALHEVMHGLGLDHPGDYDGGVGPGDTYGSLAEYYQDTHQYTLMSYWSAEFTGADYSTPGSSTLMIHDVMALQKLYGANDSAFLGHTVYGFNSNTNRDPWTVDGANENMFGSIWDSGGNDTINVSGYANRSIVDLRAGNFSSLNGRDFNLSIAPGVVIENAFGGSGNDTFYGNAAANVIIGNAGNDILRGGQGNDSLIGGTGNDQITGGSGVDLLRGDAGYDRVIYSYSSTGWNIDLARETALSRSGPTEEIIDDFEAVTGSQGNDRIFGDNGDNQLAGHNGNDQIFGRGGNDTLSGGNGNDFLSGGTGVDHLNGGNGIDTASYAYSSAGWRIDLANDTAQVRTGSAVETVRNIENADGSQGNDVIIGDGGANRLEGERGNDRLIGNGGNDVLRGEAGNDQLSGGFGVDDMDGGAGIDRIDYAYSSGGWTIDLATEQATSGGGTVEVIANFENVFGSQGNDIINGTGGANDLEGERGNDEIRGRGGNDVLEGERGNDNLMGNNGNDRLLGGAGNDRLSGGFDNDLLNGGAGADLLIGGRGSDTFVYRDTSDSTAAANDRIEAGSVSSAFQLGRDVIDLSGIDANVWFSGNQAFTFGSQGIGGVDVIDRSGVSVVVVNTDFDSAFEMEIEIFDGAQLASAYDAHDFIL